MLDFTKDYVLENEDLLLRPLQITDFDFLLEYSENEKDIWGYNANSPNSKENLEKYIAAALSNRQKNTDYPFVVICKKDNKIVGCTRYYAISLVNNTLEIGFTWYGKKYQGTGINSVCKYLLLENAFENWHFDRVGFKANSKNMRSIAAMKKIGCVEEGIMRNYAYGLNGERIDALVLSILKNEWQSTVKKNLINKITTKY